MKVYTAVVIDRSGPRTKVLALQHTTFPSYSVSYPLWLLPVTRFERFLHILVWASDMQPRSLKNTSSFSLRPRTASLDEVLLHLFDAFAVQKEHRKLETCTRSLLLHKRPGKMPSEMLFFYFLLTPTVNLLWDCMTICTS